MRWKIALPLIHVRMSFLMKTVVLPFDINEKNIADFCRRYQVQNLLLFGSVLRDDFDSNSDIDVLIEFKPDALVTFLTLSRMQRELEEMWNRPVDLVPKSGLKAAIKASVLEQSREIYAA